MEEMMYQNGGTDIEWSEKQRKEWRKRATELIARYSNDIELCVLFYAIVFVLLERN